ncbi:MAG: formylmethanofuran dehydrogenase subunit E family protein [Deltaproteobacteria bacterium]|nr:formylmethanofuran dehydrogenase subunit E family protein [Deltaproteobacteria bacterium]
MMTIGKYSLNEYLRLIEWFHGSPSPGMLVGGIMVDAAIKRLNTTRLYDAICETSSCLPDAIQLLTPCTIGNGWLHMADLGRFALALYEKDSGRGIRVFLDPEKTEEWPEVNIWHLKLRPKKEQSLEKLTDQILKAGIKLLGFQNVEVLPAFLARRAKGEIAVCPACGEAYPKNHGPVCRGCAHASPYVQKKIDMRSRKITGHRISRSEKTSLMNENQG